MTKDARTVEQVKLDNYANFIEGGSRLSTGYSSFVIVRDVEKKRILLGGLGGMGVGQMWFDEEEKHQEYPGYAEADVLAKEADPALWGEGSIWKP